MNIRGPGSFDNGATLRWLADSPGMLDRAIESLNKVIESSALELEHCLQAVAAAELICETGEDHRDLARRAVQKVFSESPLRSHWEAGEGWDAWEDAIGDLLDRLGQSVGIA